MTESPASQFDHTAFALREPKVRIAPSLLAADFTRLAEEVANVKRAGIEILHLDIMDGHFVPNLSFGPGVVADLRKHSQLFFDTHLMIDEPVRYAPAFVEAGSDLITFHVEVTDDPVQTAREIRKLGVSVGVSLNPGTDVAALESVVPHVDLVLVMSVWPGFGGQEFMPEVLEKARRVREWLQPHQRLEIDGGICDNTIAEAAKAGVDTFVAGSAVFRAADPAAAVASLHRRANDAIDGAAA